MKFPRSAGILLHPTSLPGPGGIGTLGPEAHRFAAILADMGVGLWQVLPLGPTGHGNSPYQCFSAFAGNPLLIHVEDAGAGGEPWHDDRVDFGRLIPHKQALLRQHTGALRGDDEYRAFVERHAGWLEDYALFMALKDAHDGGGWTAWDPGASRRDPGALAPWRRRLAAEVEHYRREQFLFARQFDALRAHCRTLGVRLMGDVPIYVAHDSADVWADPGLFQLDAAGQPRVVAGVPPDYFSETGQLWGNPIYDWEAMRARGYDWWIRRMRAALEMFDVVRLDHFRGFEAYWEVPAGEPTAVNGRWVEGPGAALFEALAAAVGPLPIVAENLGVITPEVEALRERLGFPGMAVLQFAFGIPEEPADLLPHTWPRELTVYTGTHDNDTTVGWWETGATDEERARARAYLGTSGEEIHWAFIRAALGSVADTALVPLQDVLGLGSEARMNLPGRGEGNWEWRFRWEGLPHPVMDRMRELVELCGRQPE